MIVKDDFISNFDLLSIHAKTVKFEKKINEVDGAEYPAISFDVPDAFIEEIKSKIEQIKGFDINIKLCFLRANQEGAKEPYQAHNDLNMSEYTFILYLTDIGGTSFVKHKELGFNSNDESYVDEWIRDCNIYPKWDIESYCKAKPNRALFFDAHKMHRGEPVEGFGFGENARMVLVMFYDELKNDSHDNR